MPKPSSPWDDSPLSTPDLRGDATDRGQPGRSGLIPVYLALPPKGKASQIIAVANAAFTTFTYYMWDGAGWVTIGTGSGHNPLTIGADGEHSLASQVLSGVDAAAAQKGHIQLAGQLGGSAAAPDVRGLRETGTPTLLTMGAVTDGQFLKRVGSTLVGAAAGGGTLAVQEDDANVDTAVTTLDFTEPDAVLVTSSPAGEANIAMNKYALLAGRSGGQSLRGGLLTAELLTLIDSVGVTRYILTDTTPHHYLIGDVKTSRRFSVNDVDVENNVLGLFREATLSTGKVGVMVDLGGSSGNPTSAIPIGVSGRCWARASAQTNAYGLDYIAGSAQASHTMTETDAVRAQLSHVFAVAGLTITRCAAFHAKTPSLDAPTGVFTTVRGLWIEPLTVGDNRRPITEEGVGALTADAHGNRLRSNTQFGSLTGSFGTGDGVIGIANAAVSPSTNPAAGIVLASIGAQLYQRALMSVNEPVHSTLSAQAAGAAQNTFTAETVLNSTTFNIPANALVVGAVLRIQAQGIFGTTGTPTLEIRCRWGGVGGVSLGTSAPVTMPSNVANNGWRVDFLIRVVSIGATGTMECQGYFKRSVGATTSDDADMQNTAVITVDTTAAKDLVLTAAWGASSPSNTITVRQYTLERIY